MILVVANQALREALTGSLSALGPFRAESTLPVDAANSRHALISTTVDLAPDDCRHLAARGVRVVILATLPNAVEEAAYRRAGVAAYLPMGLNSHSLADQVRPFLNHQAPP